MCTICLKYKSGKGKEEARVTNTIKNKVIILILRIRDERDTHNYASDLGQRDVE